MFRVLQILLIVASIGVPAFTVLYCSGFQSWAIGLVAALLFAIAIHVMTFDYDVAGWKGILMGDRAASIRQPIVQVPVTEPEKRDWLIEWIASRHLKSGGVLWKILVGAAVGVVIGEGIVIHDLHLVEKHEGFFLPFGNAKDSLAVQVNIFLLSSTIWGATFGSFFTSAIYRRAGIVAISFTSLFSIGIGISVDEPLGSLTLLVTFAMAIVLVGGFIVDLDEEESTSAQL